MPEPTYVVPFSRPLGHVHIQDPAAAGRMTFAEPRRAHHQTSDTLAPTATVGRTLCGQDMDADGVWTPYIPDADTRICATCASAAEVPA